MHHTEFPDTFNLPQQQHVGKKQETCNNAHIKRSEWIKYFMILYAYVEEKKTNHVEWNEETVLWT